MKLWTWFAAAGVMAITVTAFGAALPKEEPLWPAGVPGKAIVHKQAEKNGLKFDEKTGKASGGAMYVSVPTLMVFPAAKEKSTHAAVVVYPGGGYINVVLGKEGISIAQRLNEMGITAVVVKYRTLAVEPNTRPTREIYAAQLSSIIADGKQAVRIVRSRAAELGVDPNKIGVMGFSAGGHLSAAVAWDADAGNKNASDPVQRVSCRPDFLGLIYPGVDDSRFASVKPGLGPCFIAVSANDDKTEPNKVIPFFFRLQKAKVPSELHIFQTNGHGFGVGKPDTTNSTWLDVFGVWLKQNGFVRK